MSEGVQGVGLMALFVLGWELLCLHRNQGHFEAAYWAERRGRARVEAEMKRLAEVNLNTSEGFFVQPIAVVKSCFRQCVGTPRQGLLVPHSRATIELTRNMSPEALDGLDEFSHVWLTFKFHLNTNTLKEAKAFSGTREDSRKYTFTAKITPPMLKEKKGVLATRSPHRPNPIGVTLAKIEKVDKTKRLLHVSACDLVDGTPVLDIKPYVPAYDTVSPSKVPTWIAETIDTRNEVTISEKAKQSVHKIQKNLIQFKNDPDAFLVALMETLEADVRSKFQTNKRIQDAQKGQVVEVPFDEATVHYLWSSSRVMDVVNIVLTKEVLKEKVLEDGLNLKEEKNSSSTFHEEGDNNSDISEDSLHGGD